jgi:hypothetical protein
MLMLVVENGPARQNNTAPMPLADLPAHRIIGASRNSPVVTDHRAAIFSRLSI